MCVVCLGIRISFRRQAEASPHYLTRVLERLKETQDCVYECKGVFQQDKSIHILISGRRQLLDNGACKVHFSFG